MIGRTNAQGGKDRLKLRFFGGAQPPSIPRENDIWLQTNVPIRQMELYPYIPTWLHIEGHVFIQTVPATSGELPNFNATNPTGREDDIYIWLRLNTAVQLINGTWVRLNGWIYHGSQWYQFSSAWSGELFDNGNQYTNVTGGWTGADSYSPNLSATLYNGTITISTARAVDLSRFSTLKFMGSGNGANSGGAYSAKCKIFNESGAEVASRDFQNNNTYAMSVSALSGKHYVRFIAQGSRGNNLNISKVWLE